MVRACIVALVLLVPAYAHAAITFTGGKWGTTFAQSTCPQQTLPTGFSCDGMTLQQDTGTVNNYHSTVANSANNPSGGGGNGFTHAEEPGMNNGSETLQAMFPSLQQELWIRMYVNFPSNWSAGTLLNWYKFIYLYASGQNPMIEPNDGGFRLLCQGVNTQTCSGTQTSYKVSDMLGGTVGDNKWHAIEFHMKMDTNGTAGSATADGLGDLWIDGVNIIHATNVNWSQGVTAAKSGVEYAAFNVNQATIVDVNGVVARVLVDDIAIYNTTPPNTDAGGRAFIGLLQSSIVSVSSTTTASGGYTLK